MIAAFFFRAMFVLGPALLFGVPAVFLDWRLGLIVFASMVWLGVQMTTPRPERGESYRPLRATTPKDRHEQ